ncbi:MAG: hypothetical protein GWN18_11195, partial [Thermoplasmata archaeon]|nr:hypothetical protein [Thermoplasmata archaeon]NIS12600.1 hypothetical protein [Thermoplasmata archaeon]NIS20522.1 hypothetical protein [Thermoplasmata archaeon]NIT77900.1 hypothetical protein [Thermoplasmata archaeon]NIU49611.1 hypothetical protein [Thermoplasmata archaeon]
PVAPASSVELLEEFEPYEDEPDEEISQEEYEAERRRMRRRRAAGTVAATLLGILAAMVVFVLIMGPSVLPYVDSFQPTSLQQSDLAAPQVPEWDPELGDEPPTPSGATSANAQYVISWTTSQVFVGWGGTMRVNVTNKGGTDIYVQQVRFFPEWTDGLVYYPTNIGRYVPPGEEVHIGLLAFDGPAAPGIYNYHFEVDLMVKRPLLGTWADIPSQSHNSFEMEVRETINVAPYQVHTNDKDVYRKVNDLIEPNDPRVADLADQVRQGLGDQYNIYWVAALFDWVISELEYKSDPSEGDEWAPPGQTCDLLTGDCEDYSILIASVVEHWGGNAQFYIITKHAFAAVYLGPRTMDEDAVLDALGMYYGTSPRYAWFVDDLGYWIIADGTSSQYLGGLPYGGVATDAQGGWDIENTEYLYVTDIYPGYPE